MVSTSGRKESAVICSMWRMLACSTVKGVLAGEKGRMGVDGRLWTCGRGEEQRGEDQRGWVGGARGKVVASEL